MYMTHFNTQRCDDFIMEISSPTVSPSSYPSPSPSSSSDSPQLSILDRWSVIVLSKKLSWRAERISHFLHCNIKTVYQILHKYEHFGDVCDLPRSGRPPVIEKGSKLDDVLIGLLREFRFYTPALIASKFEKVTKISLSPKSIKRLAYRAGFRRVLTSKAPLLTEKNKEQRRKFAEKNVDEEWDDVVFTDEKLFEFNTGGRVWKQPEEPPIIAFKSQQGYKWMVWGGIWKGGRTRLHIRDADDTIDSEEYQNILWEYFIEPSENNEIPNPFLRILQDNAKPHKSSSTEHFLENFHVTVVPDYPANSPDLNPIEKVWSWMTQYIETQGPSTPEEYLNLIEDGWQKIPQSIIDAFIEHEKVAIESIAEGKSQ